MLALGTLMVFISLIASMIFGFKFQEETSSIYDPTNLVIALVLFSSGACGLSLCYVAGGGNPISPEFGEVYTVIQVAWWYEKRVTEELYSQKGALLRSEKDKQIRFYLVDNGTILEKDAKIQFSQNKQSGKMEARPYTEPDPTEAS